MVIKMLLLFVASSTSHSIGFHSGDSVLCMEIHKDQVLRSSICVAITTWIGVLFSALMLSSEFGYV